VRLLLDTHVVIWWLQASERLSGEVASMINHGGHEIVVSAVAGCEMAQKRAVGKLRVPDDLERQIAANEFTELPITLRHGLAAGELPPHHRDPFDRLLIAQARCEGLTLVTANRKISAYDVPILPA
jgi:PIN domain nuclease of toxin-antitoxin system